VEPAKHLELPHTLEVHIALQQHQMRVYTHKQPEAEQYERLPVLWARWVDAKEMLYPRGVQDTWLCFWEIVGTQLGVEYALTDYIELLLAPPPPPAAISSENSNNSVIIISSNDEDKVKRSLSSL